MDDPLDLVSYLESKGVQVKSATDSNIHTSCWYCNEDEHKRGRLYISVDRNESPPGKFFCHLCGESGAINKIRKHFGDPSINDDGTPYSPDHEDVSESNSRILEVQRLAADFYYDQLGANEAAFQYLRHERGLLFETIESHRLGWANGSLHTYLAERGVSQEEAQATGLVDRYGKDFLKHHITIPYIENGQVHYIRGRDLTPNAKAKYMTPPGSKTRIYNVDALRGATNAVVTEGEFDALVMEQLGYDAVGLAGANVWQDKWADYFTEVKKTYVIFDNDETGHIGAEKVSMSIGPSSRIVTMPEHQDDEPKNDISEWIINKGHTRGDMELLLVKSRGGLLLTVDDAYEEWLEVQNASGIKLGLPIIDQQIAPGILPGQVAVVLAKSGVGKTVSMLNMFERMVTIQPDIKILFLSLEQTRGDWFERAHRIHRFYDLQSTYQDTLACFRDNLIIMDKNQISEEELLQALEQYELEMGCKPDLICVDYLGYWARAYPGESYERTSKAIMAMKRIAKDFRIPFLTPHQLSRGTAYGEEPDIDNARDSGVIVETADFIFSLWSPDQKQGTSREERTGALNLKIGKSRHGGVGTVEHLQFAPYSLVMVPKFDPYYKFAVEEHKRFSLGDTYEQVLKSYEDGNRILEEIKQDYADLDKYKV